MVTTTRAQAVRKSGTNVALDASTHTPPDASLWPRPRTHRESSVAGANMTTTMVDNVSVDVLDLTEEDTNIPSGSILPDRTGAAKEGRNGMTSKVTTITETSTTPTVVLMKSAMKRTARGSGRWWNEDEVGPRPMPLRDSTQAKRRKTGSSRPTIKSATQPKMKS
jgi:hypothetical protein